MTTPASTPVRRQNGVTLRSTGQSLTSFRKGVACWTNDHKLAKGFTYEAARRMATKTLPDSYAVSADKFGTTDLDWYGQRDKLVGELLALRPTWNTAKLEEAAATEGLVKLRELKHTLLDLDKREARFTA